MSTPKVIRAAQNLLRQVSRMAYKLTKGFVSWLLRSLFVVGRQPLLNQAGFVLPTTILLLLVVVLTVGAIGYRTFTRTQQSIGERQQQVIYNAATPVIDRAKSKLEFLFAEGLDTPAANENQILSTMLNETRNGAVARPADPYTFDGERRIDINGGGLDNAWWYPVDLDGDGRTDSPGNKDGIAVYSIVFDKPPTGGAAPLQDSRLPALKERASKLQVRNSPLSNANRSSSICERAETSESPVIASEGWFPDELNPSKLRKNFQVNAYVVPNNPSAPIATLEFQQDREATANFKWAAWFKNDLEIFPGPIFNWNGAMHSEGNIFIGDSNNRFRAYLVSSTKSCISDKTASEINVKENEQDKPIEGTPAFKGRFIAGSMKTNEFKGSGIIDLPGTGANPATEDLNQGTDSVEPGGLKPADFALDPVVIQTKGLSVPRNNSVKPEDYEAGNWPGGKLNQNGEGRLYNDKADTTPYLDDTFRADNRWGPKPTWGQKNFPIGVTDTDDASTTATAKIGQPITGAEILTGSDPKPGEEAEDVGLDGYWERRARLEGLRLIVGQRLELGDPAGWGGPGGAGTAASNDAAITGSSVTDAQNRIAANEPLRPWREGCAAGVRCNEERQRKSLWDNLAAVQATAVYHNAKDTTADQRDFPDACLISTVHPGTPTTLDRSATFESLLPTGVAVPGYPNNLVISDVFRGRGTNGWEFDTPRAADFRNTSSPLMRALANLANYAGDPNGGAPSFEVSERSVVHPYPSMAMWGDFSMLRRVLAEVEKVGYDKLSPADKTTLHTAACTLGMLAYNVDYLEKFDISTVPATLLGVPDTDPTLGGPTGIQVSPAILTSANYAQGLRGRIRVIDHLVLQAITPAQAQTIVAANRPPAAFVNSIVKTSSTDSLISSATLTTPMQIMVWDPAQSNNPETYVRLLERWRDALPAADPQRAEMNQIIALARLIVTKEQVARDRTFGFRGLAGQGGFFYSTAPLGNCGNDLETSSSNRWRRQTPVGLRNAAGTTVGELAGGQVRPDPLSRFCSARPRYPILYSLFPARLPDPTTPPLTSDSATINASYGALFQSHGDISDTVGDNDLAVRDSEDRRLPTPGSYINRENDGIVYSVVKPEEIKLNPIQLSQSGVVLGGTGANNGRSQWVLPNEVGTPAVGATPNNNRFNLIKICSTSCSEPANTATTFQLPRTGNLVRVAFKDSSLYNGRELLPVRTMDLDLDLMKRTTAPGGDLWLPTKSLVYAYREDAVSEAHIVRRSTANWNACDTDAEIQATTCTMNTGTVNAYNSIDPPVNTQNGISPKSVDYYPDPDRRPHGFRLRQGVSLERAGDEGRGLSFISDDPVYVQGDFNLHQKGGTQIEEFQEKLRFAGDGRYENFYTRSNLDLDFATAKGDDWRPSEIVSDAVTLISGNFCDGSILDGLDTFNGNIPNWLNARYGCGGNVQVTSFLNQTRPNNQPATPPLTSRGAFWEHTNMIDSFPRALDPAQKSGNHNRDEGESPVFMRRDGKPIQWRDETGSNQVFSGAYSAIADDKKLLTASDSRMNMLIVSNAVPSRANQSYGGLHNFPRFLENWGNLNISGAFLQLGFSNYATAPFDQESWQPGAPLPTGGTELIKYYGPPNRRWGYDVGMQYAAPGPVAQRFRFAEPTRSEFYSEPPANDPYIRNLCLAAAAAGSGRSCPE